MNAPTTPPPPPASGPQNVATSPAQPMRKKGSGCWAWGCGGCLTIILILVGFGAWVGLKVRDSIQEPFEPVVISEPEERELNAKMAALDERENGQGAMASGGEIRLTETELNYWLSEQDESGADVLRLDLEPGEITANLRVGDPGSDQRMSMSGRISLQQTDNGLDIRLKSLKMGGLSIPKFLMKDIANENLAAEAFADPEVRKAFDERVERIEVLKDAILLELKPLQP